MGGASSARLVPDRRGSCPTGAARGPEPEEKVRAASLIAAFALLAACGDEQEPPEVPEERDRAAAATDAEQREYAILRGQDTLALERVTLEEDAMRGEISAPAQGSAVRYSAALGPDSRVRRAEFDVQAGAGAPPVHAALEVVGDSVRIREGDDTSSARNQTRALPSGGTIYLAPSVGLMQPLLEAARTRGASLPVLVLSLDQAPRIVRADVQLAGDSAVVSGLAGRFVLRLDERGRITSGVNEEQNLRLVAR